MNRRHECTQCGKVWRPTPDEPLYSSPCIDNWGPYCSEECLDAGDTIRSFKCDVCAGTGKILAHTMIVAETCRYCQGTGVPPPRPETWTLPKI